MTRFSFSRFFGQLPRRAFLLFLAAGWLFIFSSSLAYFDFSVIPEFMLEKLPLRHETLWLYSLRVHVAAALLSLPLCIVLMTRFIQRHPKIHRVLGRIAGMTLLLALVPTGAVLAFDAKGGRIVTAGFFLSGAIVAVCTVVGIRAARRGDLLTHQRMMRHVFAQMSVAVSSRAMLIGFDFAGVDPDLAYVVALWGPVLASAVVVELVSFVVVGSLHSLKGFVVNLLRWLSTSVLALSFVPQIALADDSSLATRMQQHIETDFVKPLVARENDTSRFSRMMRPPQERRVRMTQTTPSKDQAGRAFLAFAIDAKYVGSADWRENDITGCVYSEKGDMFVKIGDSYRPSSFYLGGGSTDPVAGVCVAAAPKA